MSSNTPPDTRTAPEDAQALDREKEILSRVLDGLRPGLEQVEKALDNIITPPAGYVRDLVHHVRGFGGKRLRPALVLVAGGAVDPDSVGQLHAEVGAIVELIHTATLVHDDILDGAMIRRMQPTVHALDGTEVAVLLGDYLLASAYAAAATLSNPLASGHLAAITRVVCQGEILQVHNRGNLDLPEASYLEIIEKKTAVLYAASCEMGSRYSNGTEEQVEALTDYGLGLGMAFQIIDDILDLTGDEEVVGKSLGTDLSRCKLTLPLIHFLHEADPAVTSRVRRTLEAGRGGAEAGAIRDAVLAAGSVDFSRERANSYVRDAAERLRILPDTEARGTLEALAEYTLARQR